MSLASDHRIPHFHLLSADLFFYCCAAAIWRICSAWKLASVFIAICPAQFGRFHTNKLTKKFDGFSLPMTICVHIFSPPLVWLLETVPSSCSPLLARRENTSCPQGNRHGRPCVESRSRQDPGSPVAFYLGDLIVVAGRRRCNTSSGSSRRD